MLRALSRPLGIFGRTPSENDAGGVAAAPRRPPLRSEERPPGVAPRTTKDSANLAACIHRHGGPSGGRAVGALLGADTTRGRGGRGRGQCAPTLLDGGLPTQTSAQGWGVATVNHPSTEAIRRYRQSLPAASRSRVRRVARVPVGYYRASHHGGSVSSQPVGFRLRVEDDAGGSKWEDSLSSHGGSTVTVRPCVAPLRRHRPLSEDAKLSGPGQS
ncbi:uncharacterized protein Tco025E_09863, partial [Trypanosoma conorhini]